MQVKIVTDYLGFENVGAVGTLNAIIPDGGDSHQTFILYQVDFGAEHGIHGLYREEFELK